MESDFKEFAVEVYAAPDANGDEQRLPVRGVYWAVGRRLIVQLAKEENQL